MNYYFSTLVGRDFEQTSRGRAIEDADFTALHEGYGAASSRWRLRALSHTVLHEPAPPSVEPAVRESSVPLPNRYCVADVANSCLEVALGPAHSGRSIVA